MICFLVLKSPTKHPSVVHTETAFPLENIKFSEPKRGLPCYSRNSLDLLFPYMGFLVPLRVCFKVFLYFLKRGEYSCFFSFPFTGHDRSSAMGEILYRVNLGNKSKKYCSLCKTCCLSAFNSREFSSISRGETCSYFLRTGFFVNTSIIKISKSQDGLIT